MHLFSLIILLAIGIDFGIYMSNTKKLSSTILAIKYSILSTFGVLVFSSITALNSIGLVISIGILAIFFLDTDSVISFEKKFQTNLMQLFGSTETGGIAYKFGASSKWTPLKKVSVSQKDDKLCINSPFISVAVLDKKIIKLEDEFVTEDIVELEKDKFRLIGRVNKIIKIAGKRVSAIQIENILKEIDSIKEVIVELVYKKELLRSEQILITVESNQEINKKEIKRKIGENFGVLTIPFTLKYVDKIRYSSVGKKILF